MSQDVSLTPHEINDIIEDIGSASLVARATGRIGRSNPQAWANGTAMPEPHHMQRLMTIRRAFDIIKKKRNNSEMARAWFTDARIGGPSLTPLDAIRKGRFSTVLEAAEQSAARGRRST